MMEHNNPWQIKGAKEIYNNPWIAVTEYDVINPSGNPGIYGKVHFKNVAIGVITLDEQLHTHLVGQFRFPLNQYSWEIPEGGAPEGEDPLEAAKRELKEETGLLAEHWTHILTMHLSNSVSDEIALVYLAQGLQQEEADPEETEDLRVKSVSLDNLYESVNAGEITDSMTVAAVLKVKLMLSDGKIKV